ncbi:something about silencing, SAS, complex subunit 4-domain-containing protein, partial [Scheffersomyces xylosifermentans]|uniref:something about silencing, SAS, complex subunit 4-domain-containing protein n=1 Tax=Scheffersomyces xylosifermentans TaxID=1304137 RepID=UPI00315D44A5
RKLRSKDSHRKEPSQTLFNFENLNRLIYRNQKITVSNSTSYKNLYVYNADSQLPPSQAISKTSDIKIRKDIIPRKSRSKAAHDPLPDKAFDAFHRKMKKDEKVMTNEDKLRILSEVDNLQSQLKLLNQYDWIRHLPTIAYIKDPRDFTELEQKRALTIHEVERLIRKQEHWRKRLEIITASIKEFETYGDDEIEEDQYSLSMEALRARRQKERRQLYGPKIKLRLNNLYTLIIDPILPPKIVKNESLT